MIFPVSHHLSDMYATRLWCNDATMIRSLGDSHHLQNILALIHLADNNSTS